MRSVNISTGSSPVSRPTHERAATGVHGPSTRRQSSLQSIPTPGRRARTVIAALATSHRRPRSDGNRRRTRAARRTPQPAFHSAVGKPDRTRPIPPATSTRASTRSSSAAASAAGNDVGLRMRQTTTTTTTISWIWRTKISTSERLPSRRNS